MYKINNMLLNFTKMQGLGNDFIIIDNIDGKLSFNGEQIESLANRRFGIGFDQLLVVQKSSSADADFRYIVYNSDGSEVSQCGNGARCIARYIKENKLSDKSTIKVETNNGLMTLQINDDDSVCVDMGKPNFSPEKIPLLISQEKLFYSIEGFELGALSIGNPHCVLTLDDIASIDIENDAIKIQQNELLPEGANIGFMQIISRKEINLRVYERGAGETLACGSGACAAVIHGINTGKLDNTVNANLTGGMAVIEYRDNGHVYLSGPAEFVFNGKIEINI